MSDVKSSAAPQATEPYRYWSREPLRFSDVDMQGHVNNLALAVLAENSRSTFLREAIFPIIDRDAFMLVSVKLTLEFHREVNYPGVVDVGTGLQRIGTSSIEFAQGLFSDGDRAATATTVLVQIAKDSRRPAPWTAEVRAALSKWLITEGRS
jgi:acyl-CoA thioester hydrolase